MTQVVNSDFSGHKKKTTVLKPAVLGKPVIWKMYSL